MGIPNPCSSQVRGFEVHDDLRVGLVNCSIKLGGGRSEDDDDRGQSNGQKRLVPEPI